MTHLQRVGGERQLTSDQIRLARAMCERGCGTWAIAARLGCTVPVAEMAISEDAAVAELGSDVMATEEP